MNIIRMIENPKTNMHGKMNLILKQDSNNKTKKNVFRGRN